ncbi:MAG: IPT/TIG domain-containing protein [Candidatus Marinimicrobia bacterium]|nr:IPT/TIG domain-containing protein [Candidatus Neomarinimicrobiota bacterium]
MKPFTTINERRKVDISMIKLILLFLLMSSFVWAQGSNRRTYPAGYRPEYIPPLKPSQTELLQDRLSVSLPFSEDFESGAHGWITDGFYHLKEDPQHIMVLNPVINPSMVRLPDDGYLPSARSGTGVMWYGEDITGTFIGHDFDPDQVPLSGGTSVSAFSGSLISPEIDLTGILHAQLEFSTWWEIEGVDAHAYDMTYVDISIDNGTSFEVLGTLNPLNDLDGEAYVAFTNSGLGEPTQWAVKIFDLSAHAGNHVLIRFRFETVDEFYNGFRGWFIDDVMITEGESSAPVITSVEPNTGIVESMFEIIGNNFVNGAVVFFNEYPIPSSVLNTQKLQCQAPHLSSGI